MNHEEAFDFAYKHGPSDKTRKIVYQDSLCALYYARNIDKCPREDTRKAVCQYSGYAYWYAKEVDMCPHEETRKAACKDSLYAYCYALEIDKCFREDTWMAVKGTEYEEKYKRILKKLVKEQII